MKTIQYHIAQINIARARASLDDPLMADFVRQLDEVNALAERSTGFIWRLKDEGGGASSYIRAFDDDRMLINMSVWESVEALKNYVYRTHHGRVFRDRKKWFEPPDKSPLAIWWIPVGETPTVEEGLRRLNLLWQTEPSPEAFTFKQMFEAPCQNFYKEPAETKTSLLNCGI